MDQRNPTIETLFREALELPPDRRNAFLQESCRGAPELRRAVENRLAGSDRLAGSMTQPADANAKQATPPPGRRLPPGTMLGRYRIVDTLGSGGMGVVYRARDEKLERTVAIKMLPAGVLLGEELRRHFRQEALALAKLNHPHIAAIYDVGDQDGIDYIVMEWVQGEPLTAKLRSGPLSLQQATSIAVEIASALKEAHSQGVIHRDLKPGNVVVTPAGHAKVLDFGLAKLLDPLDTDSTLPPETQGIIGTPLYMSPEQACGSRVDARTDLWSLGVLYYESLTGRTPFRGKNPVSILRAVAEDPYPPVRTLLSDLPSPAEKLIDRALKKKPDERYQTAAEMEKDASELLLTFTAPISAISPRPHSSTMRWTAAALVLGLLLAGLAGVWIYRRAAEKQWARDEAIPQIDALIGARKPLAAMLVLERAEKDLPNDPQLRQLAAQNTIRAAISSDPPGALVEIQDYLAPDEKWFPLGTTPLTDVRIPQGYFRWKVSKAGTGEMIIAPQTSAQMNFPLSEFRNAPGGMVYVPSEEWSTYNSFLGWVGPYKLPPYYVDRFEVTNREYQRFVDNAGYTNPKYWPSEFHENSATLSWSQAMARFRDSTGRPGPSTWAAGHYPEGQADFPVSGVSWFEASAYAAYSGKTLPVLGQWYQAAPPDLTAYITPVSNIGQNAPAAVGAWKGLGPYGTYDTAGNVREWVANVVDDNLRFILGGSFKSQAYLYSSPEALSPFDRSEGNGFRCVRNLAPLPKDAANPYHRVARDFAAYKPAPDDVFRAYTLLYAYPDTPLNARVEGIVKETEDWREEKVSFDTAYNGERMSAYLFLPKRVKPPYQTILFFPSARVFFLPPDSNNLGDTKFFDYIVQSGRAVVYPVYEDTYERRVRYRLPGGSQGIDLTTQWYKDAGRTLDYLKTRPDIDSSRLAYLGVSVGAADGAIIATLLQDRLKTVIFLDGGYFLGTPPPGGDQADFVPRLKKPVLMVNGRYDYTFPVDKAQDPMFQMLGTPAAQKSHVILDTPHDVNDQRSQLIKAVLDWLDQYLGRVDN